MKAAQQTGDDVGVLGVEVVPRAIEVGGHDAAVVAAMLTVIALAELDAGDLGEGVGFVGRLQGAGEQGLLRHGLGCALGVDAGGAEEQQLLHPMLMGGVDQVGLDHQVLVDEVGRIGIVGVDATDPGGADTGSDAAASSPG